MTPETLALVATTAPLVAFAIALVAFRKRHAVAAGLVIGAGLVSLVCSLIILRDISDPVLFNVRWLRSGQMDIGFGFLLDGRSALMGVIVTLISFCIQVYSLGYMADDPGKGRFFAFLGLFSWSMLSFVYSSNLLQTFIFWELVGLASFLLIGFWYHKPSAVAAAKKAFVMTRIGDVGLFIGLIMLLEASGTLDIATCNTEGAILALGQTRVDMITLLLFTGIVGKSAQFPLHTWLPDAMEGPTPVSALLHSATMVAAGVFLFARFHGLFMASPSTLTIALGLGCITALLASTMAVVALDIKKVLAYSSMSQLGFMIMGLAAGGLFAGMFHLTTHAIFKALLFLTAGAYIHHFHTNDMVAIGRAGGRSMKATSLGLLIGGLALAGVPPLAGFWSKEAIFHALGHSGQAGMLATLFSAGAYAAAFLTAYYSGRMIFLVLRPNPDGDLQPEEEAHVHVGAHHHDPEPWVIKGPILLLTAGAAVAGFGGGWIADKLGLSPDTPSLVAMLPAIAIVAAGLGLAWMEFGREGARQRGFITRWPRLEETFKARWHVDTIYRRIVGKATIITAKACKTVEDRIMDGGTDTLAEGTVDIADVTRKLQSGNVQLYIAIATALIAAGAYLVGVA